MTTEDFKRKLTTILHADVQNYSRLMGEDEDATVRTLTAYREVMGVFIQKHRGRVVHGSGDSLLVEFVSVVDAVRGLRPHAPPLTMSVVLTGNKIQCFSQSIYIGTVFCVDIRFYPEDGKTYAGILIAPVQSSKIALLPVCGGSFRNLRTGL